MFAQNCARSAQRINEVLARRLVPKTRRSFQRPKEDNRQGRQARREASRQTHEFKASDFSQESTDGRVKTKSCSDQVSVVTKLVPNESN